MKKPRNYWTEELIREFVKEHNIKTKCSLEKFKDGEISGKGAFYAAVRFGIIDDLFEKKELIIWNIESIREFVKTHQIYTRKELFNYKDKDNNISGRVIYGKAKSFGLLDELFGEVVSWTEEKVRAFVKKYNIKSRKALAEFKNGKISGCGAY